MSITYTITTNFGSKDSLPTGDSNKIIKGAEFTTEFNAIKSAFALAAPVANPTFTGTVDVSGATLTLADNQISGDKVEGGTIAATTITDLTTTTVNIGDWDIKLDGSDLVFNYSGTDVFKITTAGATIALDDVTAFGTP